MYLLRSDQRPAAARHILVYTEAVDGNDPGHPFDHLYRRIPHHREHILNHLRFIVIGHAQGFFSHQIARLIKAARDGKQGKIPLVMQLFLLLQGLRVDPVLPEGIPVSDLLPVLAAGYRIALGKRKRRAFFAHPG